MRGVYLFGIEVGFCFWEFWLWDRNGLIIARGHLRAGGPVDESRVCSVTLGIIFQRGIQ